MNKPTSTGSASQTSLSCTSYCRQCQHHNKTTQHSLLRVLLLKLTGYSCVESYIRIISTYLNSHEVHVPVYALINSKSKYCNTLDILQILDANHCTKTGIVSSTLDDSDNTRHSVHHCRHQEGLSLALVAMLSSPPSSTMEIALQYRVVCHRLLVKCFKNERTQCLGCHVRDYNTRSTEISTFVFLSLSPMVTCSSPACVLVCIYVYYVLCVLSPAYCPSTLSVELCSRQLLYTVDEITRQKCSLCQLGVQDSPTMSLHSPSKQGSLWRHTVLQPTVPSNEDKSLTYSLL